MNTPTDMNNTMEHQNKPQPVYAAVFGSIMVLGLPLNAVSLWILLRRHSLKSTSAVFMVNLALSDLLLVISLPMRVYFYATGTWPLGLRACNVITMLLRNNMRSGAIFITFISVDRLLAVVYPLRSRHLRTSSNAWRAAALIWVFVVVMNIPESVHFSRFSSNHSESICFKWNPHLDSAIHYFMHVLLFILLAVNIVCTALVSWTLRKHLNESAKINNKVNVMLIFVMNMVMFTVCFLPLNVGIAMKAEDAIIPLTCLAAVNCCLDPVLYYFSFDGFWKKKKDVDPGRELDK